MINKKLVVDSHASMDEPRILLPAVYVQSGRLEFRKVFIEHFPSFIYFLHNSIPQITSSEEILCMLIFLRQSTDDIAAILGICRKSVKQSRYRLRQKIDIPTKASLNEFVYNLLPEN